MKVSKSEFLSFKEEIFFRPSKFWGVVGYMDFQERKSSQSGYGG